jgi:hypothetical protein
VTLDALAAGSHERRAASFISRLRAAGTALGSASQRDQRTLVAELTRIAEDLRALGQAAAAPAVASVDVVAPAVTRPATPPKAVPTAPPPAAATAVEQAPAPAPVAPEPERADIAASWAEYESLRERLGDGEPSLEELVGGISAAAAPVAAVLEHGVPAPEVEEAELISITELCYSGHAALQEAHSVRDRIRSELAESEWDAAQITELIDELLDLVELGIGQT